MKPYKYTLWDKIKYQLWRLLGGLTFTVGKFGVDTRKGIYSIAYFE